VTATDQDTANTKQMTDLLNGWAARELLDQPGIGPVTAAVSTGRVVTPGPSPFQSRVRPWPGVNPIPASSGNTVRHRVNRGGDRA
jgi:transposase